jgi:hypothetical protein
LHYRGTVHFAYPRDTGYTAFVGDQWHRVDLVGASAI